MFYSKNGKNYLLVGVPYKWLMAAPAGEVVIDPTVHAATVEDTWLEDATNHGDRDRLLIGKSAGNPKKRSLIKFDLSGIPAGVELGSAKMRLQYYGRGGDLNATWVDRPVSAHKILVDWNELEATTTRRMIDVAAQNVNAIDVLWNASYGQSGTDYSAIAEDTQFITPDFPRWVSWDIKDLTQAWIDGAATNYGVMLLATNEDVDGFDLRFRSSDYTADEQFRPKLEIRWTLATRTTYFLKDHLGTTRAAITDAGDVVGYDDYDPWGLILKKRSMTSQPNMPFKYTGKEWDDDNGLNLYYFGARYYDPVVARWMAADPLRNSLAPKKLIVLPDFLVSPYTHVLNNPGNNIDPNGLWTYGAGFGAIGQAVMFGAHGTLGLIGDFKGNVGITLTVGKSVGVGFGGGPGAYVQLSSAGSIYDTRGRAATTGLHSPFGGIEANGMYTENADGSMSKSPTSWGVTVSSPSAGGGVYLAGETTYVAGTTYSKVASILKDLAKGATAVITKTGQLFLDMGNGEMVDTGLVFDIEVEEENDDSESDDKNEEEN